jgi:hypothetical protein
LRPLRLATSLRAAPIHLPRFTGEENEA